MDVAFLLEQLMHFLGAFQGNCRPEEVGVATKLTGGLVRLGGPYQYHGC